MTRNDQTGSKPMSNSLLRFLTVLLAVLVAAAPTAHAQWTVTNLHPAGATGSEAWGNFNGQQSGTADVGGQAHASLWSSTASSWVDLHPAVSAGSLANVISGGQQAGYAYIGGFQHASLWSGSAASWVDLTPAGATISSVQALSGGHQAGYAHFGSTYHAGFWSDTAASWVDLHPAGAVSSAAFGISGIEQAGAVGVVGGASHASLWRGTAASWIDLNPAGALGSQAFDDSNGQQAGYADVGGLRRASLWSGTAATWVDLHPAGATVSQVNSAFDGQQAGEVTIAGAIHASLWSGSAASWVGLHAYLPSEFSGSRAIGVWRGLHAMYVSGYGFNTLTNRTEALLWTQPLRPPTVTYLHPAGTSDSGAYGVSGSQQVGRTTIGGTGDRAALWSESAASWVDLHPAGAGFSLAYAVFGNQQGGYAFLNNTYHASLWSGTATSWVDLNPVGATASFCLDVSGGQQVGEATIGGFPHASLWSRTAASWVDIHPAGASYSFAWGASASKQVGMAQIGGLSHASLWSGTAASWVDLSPAGADSIAYAVSGGQQVGYAVVGGRVHASLWSDTAASWVDLHPAGALQSEAHDLSGDRQVGNAVVSGAFHASLWSGTAASWVDLHAFLPDTFSYTKATGVSSDASYIYVTGYGFNTLTGREEALLWTLPIPLTRLHPTSSSLARGISGTHQVGGCNVGGAYHAGFWSGTAASWVDLNPAAASTSGADGIADDQQVGYARVGGITHASLWSGTAASWVDLHPAGAPYSRALGVSSNQQVGEVDISGNVHASLWSGTAASWIDLNPAGATDSTAGAVSDGQQVGSAGVGGSRHAGLWTGTAASWVDLTPAGASYSSALGVSAGRQVGEVVVSGHAHASLWSGSAVSWEDLHPAGATSSQALSIYHGQQVGSAVVGGSNHASLWSGTAASWVDLHAFLPREFSVSYAFGVSRDAGFTYVAGYGFNTLTGHDEALFWTLPNTTPCGPDFSVQPQSATVQVCQSATLSVAANGVGTLHFQWRKNGVVIADDGRITGAQTPTLSFSGVRYADDATYDCVVTDDCGPANSASARLTVGPTPPWIQRTMTGPAARYAHSLTYDTTRHVSVLFGGSADTSDQQPIVGDTWESDGTAWTHRADSGPSARYRHAATFDSARGRVIVFGGVAQPDPSSGWRAIDNQTWEWDGSAWILRATTGPSPRLFYSGQNNMVYDPVRDRTILFGGTAPTGATLIDTWEFNGHTAVWTQVATDLPPIHSPPDPFLQPFTDAEYVYFDTGLGKPVLYAVEDNSSPEIVHLYQWTGAWSEIATHDMPVLRWSGWAFDTDRQQVVATSGYAAPFGFNTQTFAMAQGVGRLLRPDAPSFNRAWSAMTYDTARQAIVLFGGLVDAGDPALGDTWELNYASGPQVLSGPVSQTPPLGTALMLTVQAAGAAPLSYQWRRNSVNLIDGGRISGATTATLTINPYQAGDSGIYDCVVSNGCGSTQSNPATLSVASACACRSDMNGDHARDGRDVAQFISCVISPGAGCDCADNDGGGGGLTDIPGFISDLIGGQACP